MTEDTTTNDQIRLRLQEIVADSSQASIARKTGTPQASVSRYLKDRRIPAEFCARLVDGLGIRAGWLLTGKGSPHVEADAGDASELGTGLLQLLEAMESFRTLGLGNLARRSSRQDLVRLDRLVGGVEKLRSRIYDEIAPVFWRIEEECTRTELAGKRSQTDAHLATLCRLLRICPEPDLQEGFAEISADVRHLRGDYSGALEAVRRLFSRGLSDPDQVTSAQLRRYVKFVWQSYMDFRLDSAWRCARVLAVFYEGVQLEWWSRFQMASGAFDLELNSVTRGTDTMAAALRGCGDRFFRTFSRPLLVTGYVLRGDFDLAEAIGMESARVQGCTQFERLVAARSLFRLTSYRYSEEARQALTDRFTDEFQWANERWGESTIHLLDFLGNLRRSESDFQKLVKQPLIQQKLKSDQRVYRLETNIRLAQLARLRGLDAHSAHHTREAKAEFSAMESGQTPWIILRAAHAINIIASAEKSDRDDEQARTTLRELIRRGLAPCAEFADA